jgi:hypothetical protein
LRQVNLRTLFFFTVIIGAEFFFSPRELKYGNRRLVLLIHWDEIKYLSVIVNKVVLYIISLSLQLVILLKNITL